MYLYYIVHFQRIQHFIILLTHGTKVFANLVKKKLIPKEIANNINHINKEYLNDNNHSLTKGNAEVYIKGCKSQIYREYFPNVLNILIPITQCLKQLKAKNTKNE